MEALKRKVGTSNITYASIRNFVSLPFRKYIVKRTFNVCSIPNKLPLQRFKQCHKLFATMHFNLGLTTCDILHLFNTISLSSTPWVTTFETYLPRWGIATDFGIKSGVKLLASDSCKKLIAMSKCTYDFQCRYLEKFQEHKDIVEKICVIHPAQKLMVNSYDEKRIGGDFLTFTIGGGEFFTKGGKEILIVFERLIQEGYPLKLNIISSMCYADYATKTSEKDLKEAMQIISEYSSNIFYYNRLPNKKVLEIFKNTHVGLLPTRAETYGYSVLEAQANGCPVITTNVRALPETNNENIGWIIDLPKDDWGNAVLKTEKDRNRVSKIIEEGLYEIIKTIVENPDIIKEKGIRCLQNIKEFHNPKVKAREIEAIYDESLGRR